MDRLLKNSPLFATLTASERLTLGKLFVARPTKSGEQLFRQGGLRRELLLVVSGRIRITHRLNGLEETLAMIEPGATVGEQALINPTQTHTVSGLVDLAGEVLVLQGADFLKLKRRHAHLAAKILSGLLTELADRLHHADTKLMALYATGKLTTVTPNVHELLDQILRVLLPTVRAKFGLVAFVRPDKATAVVREAIGYRTRLNGREIRLAADPIVGRVVRDGQPVTVTRDQYHRDRHWHTFYGANGVLAVPIATSNECLGVLVVGDKRQGEDFSVNNQVLLSISGRQVAAALSEAAWEQEKRAAEELKRNYILPH